MKNPTLTPSKKELSFAPRQIWPATLPPLSWRGVIYAGFGREEAPFEMVSRAAHFGEAMKAAYPRLGLGEWSRLIRCLDDLERDGMTDDSTREFWQKDRESLFEAYSLRDGDNLNLTLSLLEKTTREFQDWVDDKGISVRDLAPLRSLKDETAFEKLTTTIGYFNPSKNIGVQALEWAVDLLLGGRSTEDLLTQLDLNQGPAGFTHWHEWLRSQRFARRYQQLKELKDWGRRLPLPKDVSVAVCERGDRVGLELKMFIADAADLQSKIERLRSGI